jgi:hypothetical protein
MNITDKAFWVVSGNVRCANTQEGLLLLDFERDMYCDLALLDAEVWLADNVISSRKEWNLLVYLFKKHDMTVTFAVRDDGKRAVQLTLGSETRTFELEEFTDFWLTMIEEGRKATTMYLESLGELYRKKKANKEGSNSYTCS